MPAPKTGGLYETRIDKTEQFRIAHSILCSSGRNGHLDGRNSELEPKYELEGILLKSASQLWGQLAQQIWVGRPPSFAIARCEHQRW